MLPKAFFSTFVLFVAACATATRSPPQVAVGSHPVADAGVDGDDDGDDASETAESAETIDTDAAASPCPADMVFVATGSEREHRFCVDKYEASLVEVDADGAEKPFPHYLPVDGHAVRAVSAAGVFPQGFISEVQAEDACTASGKRLCSPVEWKTACQGPAKSTFPYGNARQPGVCNDTGKSAVGTVFGVQRLADPVATSPTTKATSKAASAKVAASGSKTTKGRAAERPAHVVSGHAAQTTRSRAARTASATSDKPAKKSDRIARTTPKPSTSKGHAARERVPAKVSARPASVEPSVWSQLNDPRLGQVEGALGRTGSHEACVSGYGVVDIVGNLHEWVKTDPSAPHGMFAGGYYLDTTLNGDGCNYRTTAHAHDYHDYSTGFRCCSDAKP